MSRFGEFGQLMALIDVAHTAQFKAANILIEQKKAKAELKLRGREIQQQGRMQELDRSFRHKELESKMSVSLRRDKLFKDIALYSGIGIITIVILIVLVIMLAGKKEKQFDYLLKGETSE